MCTDVRVLEITERKGRSLAAVNIGYICTYHERRRFDIFRRHGGSSACSTVKQPCLYPHRYTIHVNCYRDLCSLPFGHRSHLRLMNSSYHMFTAHGRVTSHIKIHNVTFVALCHVRFIAKPPASLVRQYTLSIWKRNLTCMNRDLYMYGNRHMHKNGKWETHSASDFFAFSIFVHSRVMPIFTDTNTDTSTDTILLSKLVTDSG